MLAADHLLAVGDHHMLGGIGEGELGRGESVTEEKTLFSC